MAAKGKQQTAAVQEAELIAQLAALKEKAKRGGENINQRLARLSLEEETTTTNKNNLERRRNNLAKRLAALQEAGKAANQAVAQEAAQPSNNKKPGLANRFKRFLGFGGSANETVNQEIDPELLEEYKKMILEESDDEYNHFIDGITNLDDDDDFYRLINHFFTAYNSLKQTNKNKRTSKDRRERVRKITKDRINRIVNYSGNRLIKSEFRYELVGNYKRKVRLLQAYAKVPDTVVQDEANKHLKRFKISAKTVVKRPLRNMGGPYYGENNYSGAISSANRNYRRLRSVMRARRAGGGGESQANMLKKIQLQQALAGATKQGPNSGYPSSGYPSSGYPSTGYPGSNQYRNKVEPEYEALKKLTLPPQMSTTPQAPVQPQGVPTKLYGVSAQSEEKIKKYLTPTEKNVVLRAGNLAAVDRILKAAGGTSKVRQAAEILKQVPKNEALKLRLVSKKAAAAVDIFGGPNKANAAIKVNQKITSARKKRKYKKTKTPAPKKKVAVSPLRTKVLKNVISQVPKNKLIQIAGKSVLGINEKAKTPKKVVVNDFTKYVQRKPKPKTKPKPKAKSKAKPKTKAKAAPKKK